VSLYFRDTENCVQRLPFRVTAKTVPKCAGFSFGTKKYEKF